MRLAVDIGDGGPGAISTSIFGFGGVPMQTYVLDISGRGEGVLSEVSLDGFERGWLGGEESTRSMGLRLSGRKVLRARRRRGSIFC